MLAETATPARAPQLADVADVVCRYYEVTFDELRGDGRTARITLPRQMYYLLAHDVALVTYERAGEFIGRDHSTVYQQAKAVERRIAGDSALKYDLGVMSSELSTLCESRPPVMSIEPPKVRLFGQCEVTLSRYAFGVDDLARVMSERGIPRRAWIESTDLGMDSLRITWRWSKDDEVAS